jgi:hypothetical protein
MTVQELDQAVEAEERLSHTLEQYAGQWVAIAGHAVVAHAETLEDLLVEVEGQEVERVQQVPQHAGLACFF